MEKRFIAPGLTMLAGLFIWILMLLLHFSSLELPMLIKVLMCLVAGGIVVYSGFFCRRVGGPRLGNIVRTILLLILAIITFWQIHLVAALILFVSALFTGALALAGSVESTST